MGSMEIKLQGLKHSRTPKDVTAGGDFIWSNMLFIFEAAEAIKSVSVAKHIYHPQSISQTFSQTGMRLTLIHMFVCVPFLKFKL